ncbi:large subunit ribosomal protein L24e [Strigomonas culicis]|uniref:Large subunit ribosomal protein L24e n=1 Tax=Strigomonas culicis TaxID=28005 RepID=S9W895_9TRYP|nr:large subunit ribosomal protein L24e [Strigomonas culicis]EPY31803.1 large subunit ribosomal protein L24e [Strigomonas culicis]EPY35546.1 large subunit ribosomal protein L24e [Strigomonas culicis]|eukprot:EPY24538.1 large subunit ribosomal protein L24e [Strigomonas culicis]
MRVIECEFSHYAVHPGHGRRYVPFAYLSTKPVLTFNRPKCFALYMRKKNPRFVPWTRTFRRIHRKTTTDRVTRRRAARAVKVERAYVGADLAQIKELRKERVDRSAKGKAIRAEMAERKAAHK